MADTASDDRSNDAPDAEDARSAAEIHGKKPDVIPSRSPLDGAGVSGGTAGTGGDNKVQDD